MINYFDHPAMSQSKLKDLKRSPAHFYAKHLDPMREAIVETDAMKFGSLVHTCVLEPSSFASKYFMMPDIDRRTKAGKETYGSTLQSHAGKNLVTLEQVTAAQAMRSVVANKKAAQIIFSKKGLVEKEFYFIDKDTGIEFKLKPDYFIEPCAEFPNGFIVDLKSTKDARKSEFSKSIYNFGYYNQVAWYGNNLKQIYKTEGYAPFIFIPIEKEPPYECNFFAADNKMLQAGLRENAKLLELYRSCLEKGEWPGYPETFEEIGLESWMINKLEGE